MVRKRSERHHAAGEAGQRRLRVGEEVRHFLSRVLRGGELRDPVLAGASITVTEVRMSPDLRNATAFVMPLGGAHAGEIAVALNRSAAYLRGLLGRELPLRYTPNLVFTIDPSFDEADRIAALLARPEVRRDLPPSPVGTEEPDDAG
jgi:ribosome-binding factor A